jgi:hypothetical protein
MYVYLYLFLRTCELEDEKIILDFCNLKFKERVKGIFFQFVDSTIWECEQGMMLKFSAILNMTLYSLVHRCWHF